MAEVKWIKIATDIFDDEKILLIESLPDKYAVITCWFKLLCLAGKQNNKGVFILNDTIAYTESMLATIFRMNENTVKMALDTFEKFGMIERIEGVITIPNWEKHQSLDVLEKNREYHREYMSKRRKNQKKIACEVNSKVNCDVTVNGLDIDIDKEEDKDIYKYIVPPEEPLSVSEDHKSIFNLWNECKIIVHKAMTEDIYKAITKALSLYGLDNVVSAIKHYGIIYTDANYFFKYKWTLAEFLKQANALPEFLDGGSKWENYRNSKEGKKATRSKDKYEIENQNKDIMEGMQVL